MPRQREKLTIALHYKLAKAQIDPGECSGSLTDFTAQYAFQDAMFKALPAGPMAPSLVES